LSSDPIASAASDFTLQVERLYSALIRPTHAPLDSEPTLGGKLLYIGELAPHGRALLVAGNIAGAASLAATADPSAQKLAIRDGVVDFLVNTLDEALRILKNEIRKRETVAVCVAAAPQAVEPEMLERGVLPDLLPPISCPNSPTSDFSAEEVQRIELLPDQTGQVLVSWHVAAAPAQWLPKLDALAMECLKDEAYAERRWLRLAPRYLGRLAQGQRVLHCEPGTAKEFVSRVQGAVDHGEIGVEVRISVNGDEEVFRSLPSPDPAV
jgi:urocanate hydratase